LFSIVSRSPYQMQLSDLGLSSLQNCEPK
jgi:hypothetical protein